VQIIKKMLSERPHDQISFICHELEKSLGSRDLDQLGSIDDSRMETGAKLSIPHEPLHPSQIDPVPLSALSSVLVPEKLGEIISPFLQRLQEWSPEKQIEELARVIEESTGTASH
jgi:hypothetical protein